MSYAPGDVVTAAVTSSGTITALSGTVYRNGAAQGTTVTAAGSGSVWRAAYTVPAGWALGDAVECLLSVTVGGVAYTHPLHGPIKLDATVSSRLAPTVAGRALAVTAAGKVPGTLDVGDVTGYLPADIMTINSHPGTVAEGLLGMAADYINNNNSLRARVVGYGPYQSPTDALDAAYLTGEEMGQLKDNARLAAENTNYIFDAPGYALDARGLTDTAVAEIAADAGSAATNSLAAAANTTGLPAALAALGSAVAGVAAAVWAYATRTMTAGAVGPGATPTTIQFFRDAPANTLPLADADAWVTTDAAGANVVAGSLRTDSVGEVTFMLDSGLTYFAWAQKDGFNAVRGFAFVAE